ITRAAQKILSRAHRRTARRTAFYVLDSAPHSCPASSAPSPRLLRGEGRGEGLYPRIRLVESPPHPDFSLRVKSGLSPQAGARQEESPYPFTSCFSDAVAGLPLTPAPTTPTGRKRPTLGTQPSFTSLA